jgi:hypothetical protein
MRFAGLGTRSGGGDEMAYGAGRAVVGIVRGVEEEAAGPLDLSFRSSSS